MVTRTEIARQAYLAYVDDDREALEAVIAEDFHFTSPLDNRLDRRAYFHRCWPNHENIVGFEFIRIAEVGDQVFVTYRGERKQGGYFQNTEVLTIRDSQIQDVEVYFGWNLPHPARSGGSTSD